MFGCVYIYRRLATGDTVESREKVTRVGLIVVHNSNSHVNVSMMMWKLLEMIHK